MKGGNVATRADTRDRRCQTNTGTLPCLLWEAQATAFADTYTAVACTKDQLQRTCCNMASTYSQIPPIITQPLFPQPVTALAFDPVSDTLWTGNNNGSIVAFYGAAGTRGVSFPVGGDLAVKKLLVADQYVRGLGTAGRGVGSWSKGGVNKWFYRQVLLVLALCSGAD